MLKTGSLQQPSFLHKTGQKGLAFDSIFDPFSKLDFDLFLLQLNLEKRQACERCSCASARANCRSIGHFLVELLVSLSQRSKGSILGTFWTIIPFSDYLGPKFLQIRNPEIIRFRMVYNLLGLVQN